MKNSPCNGNGWMGGIAVPRFFVDESAIAGDRVTISGADAHHIARALRMAIGEHITVCDAKNATYDCVLEHFAGDDTVTAHIVSVTSMRGEPPYRAVLYQALPKGDKLDSIIQKAVECGVVRIVPFESERCVVRRNPANEDKKNERRQRIALEAAKQCGRGIVPRVEPACGFSDVICSAADADLVLFCYEGENTVPLRTLLQAERQHLGEHPTIAIVVGSEGGFSAGEAATAREHGFAMTGLGARILRTETAAPFVLGALAYEFEL